MIVKEECTEALERVVKKVGTTAHVTIPKKYIDRKVIVLVLPESGPMPYEEYME